jgi:hypothetical protein
MKLQKFLLAAVLIMSCSMAMAEEEKKATGLSAGIETGYGDVLTYGEGFEFWVKPNIGWDIFDTGFSLGLGLVLPVYPAGNSISLELSESYGLDIGDSGFEAEFGNWNGLSLGEQPGFDGFIFAGIGYSGFSLALQAHYLSGSAFGFGGLTFVPGYSFELGNFEIGICAEIGMQTGEQISWSIVPILGCSYSF